VHRRDEGRPCEQHQATVTGRPATAPEGKGKRPATIDGFEVTTFDTGDFVFIVVELGPGAVFGLLSKNVSRGEAMELARRF